MERLLVLLKAYYFEIFFIIMVPEIFTFHAYIFQISFMFTGLVSPKSVLKTGIPVLNSKPKPGFKIDENRFSKSLKLPKLGKFGQMFGHFFQKFWMISYIFVILLQL